MKNTNIGLVSLLSVLSLFVSPFIAAADTYKMSILPVDSVTVLPGILSEQMTVQSQNEDGSQAKTSEKIILTFESSSPTGEFFTATGNSLSGYKYISSNTYNRNFSYKDSTEGTFTLTVSGVGEVTGKTWTASKQITISSNTSVTENSTQNTSEDSENASFLSATSGSVAPSYAAASSQLEVSAGSDRLTSIGSPVSFQALVKKNNLSNGSAQFSWSFGDGYVGSGALVSHSYKYPGDYAVVLNASSGNTFAVSRLKIKVIEPDIDLFLGGDYIEISNNSSYEINLFNWKLVSGGKGFVFQPDTIIFPKSKMKLQKSMLSMKGEEEGKTSLKNFLGDEIAHTGEPIPSAEMEVLNSKLTKAREETMEIANAILKNNLVKKEIKKEMAEVANAAAVAVSLEVEDQASTSEPMMIYESNKKQNFLASIFSFIANVFR